MDRIPALVHRRAGCVRAGPPPAAGDRPPDSDSSPGRPQPADDGMSPREAAEAAADGWAKQVGAPTFRNIDDRSTGEERRTGDLAGLMQTMIAARQPVTKESGNAFAKELAKYIESQLTAQAKRG